MSMPGKFIVFEGIDSAGKKTQVNLLLSKLEDKEVELIDFPAYDTEFGKIVAKYLRGEMGKKEEVLPELASLLYTIDRYQFAYKLKEMLERGKIVIANRYTYSNLFQAAKLPQEKWMGFAEWLEGIESRLPKADIHIFLDVPPEIGKDLGHEEGIQKLQGQSRDYLGGRKNDIHEKDLDFQKRTREVYLMVAKARGWIIVNCVKDGKIRDKEEIHQEIWDKIKAFIV